jgi:serine phosphatase RsbU (regulator of sigma subunit)
VEDLVGRAGVALDNALLYGNSRRVGIALQRSLLPGSLPQVDGVGLAARYLPGVEGIEVGGDFYVAHELADGRLLVGIGDVMGRGVQAAATMGQLRSVLLTLAYGGDPPEAVLDRLASLVDDLLDLQMATVLLGVYDPARRRLRIASAGHPPPLLAPLDEEPRFLDVVPGPPLGAGPADHPALEVDVPDGATIVLYTDGVVERRGESLGDGMERLRRALVDVKLPPAAVCEHALRVTGRAEGSDDDVAIVVLSQP